MMESCPDFVDWQPPAMANGSPRPVSVESADLGARFVAELEWKVPDLCVAADFAKDQSSDFQTHCVNLSLQPGETLLH